MDKPRMLEGYRVLDFTHFVAGPTCTRILGEMGADVIKVERSVGGDHVRHLGLVRDGMSTYYFQHNHSKRSLALDLRQPRARELLLAMVPKIDVVVENFAPGVIAEMGFGYEALRKSNPRMVMCSVSVAGQTGPLSYKPGYDYLGASIAGVIDQIGEPDRAPSVPAMAIGDVSTGVAAAMAVGFALLNRERSGEGQYIDASLLDTYFHMHELTVPVVSLRPGKFVPQRGGSLHPTGSPCGVFKANGGYVFLVVQQHEIARLWRAMKRPDLAEDPRFKTNRDRIKNKQDLKQIFEEWLATFPDRESAVKVLDDARVPCAPVYKVEESMAQPHLRGRKTVRRVKHESFGEFDIPGMPIKFSTWPERTDLKASRLGGDNDAILKEVLGLTPAEIEDLYRENVLLRAPEKAAAPS
ncbi:MAG TPA: CaiB/BaiF CoA-transferase family protein [Candidatus Acidoferrales bacterium]|nr:CaiB/BaiF CoA-transferase family protein [Candidatus Acidoferrales bacterium]